jgi:hypothetical protein
VSNTRYNSIAIGLKVKERKNKNQIRVYRQSDGYGIGENSRGTANLKRWVLGGMLKEITSYG